MKKMFLILSALFITLNISANVDKAITLANNFHETCAVFILQAEAEQRNIELTEAIFLQGKQNLIKRSEKQIRSWSKTEQNEFIQCAEQQDDIAPLTRALTLLYGQSIAEQLIATFQQYAQQQVSEIIQLHGALMALRAGQTVSQYTLLDLQQKVAELQQLEAGEVQQVQALLENSEQDQLNVLNGIVLTFFL